MGLSPRSLSRTNLYSSPWYLNSMYSVPTALQYSSPSTFLYLVSGGNDLSSSYRAASELLRLDTNSGTGWGMTSTRGLNCQNTPKGISVVPTGVFVAPQIFASDHTR